MVIHLITGPPCSGKTTYVRTHRKPTDLVIDLDHLAHALGYPHEHIDPAHPNHPATLAAQILRQSLLRKLDRFRHHDIWIIDTHGNIPGTPTLINPGQDTCIARAQANGRPSIVPVIRDWYSRHGDKKVASDTPSRSW